MKKLLLAAFIVAGIVSEATLEREELFQDCMNWKGHTEEGCQECYEEVYGDESESQPTQSIQETNKSIEI